MRSLVKFLVLMLFPVLVLGQQTENDPAEQVIAQILEHLGEELDAEDVQEKWEELLRNPVDLNKADEKDMARLFFLSPLQQEAILREREKRKGFQDLLELQTLPGMDELLFSWLQYVLRIGGLTSAATIKDLSQEVLFRLSRLLQDQPGYDRSRSNFYVGDPYKSMLRYRAEWKNRGSASLVLEKDPGEYWKPDFLSGNLRLQFRGLVKELHLGDYQMQAGQGLLLWTGLNFGKGAGIAGLVKPMGGLSAYRSVNEQDFFRGAALHLSSGRFSVTPFVSYRKIDAKLTDDGSAISSMPESGLHRTASELAGRKQMPQLDAGLTALYRQRHWRIGLASLYQKRDLPLSPPDDLYRQFQNGDAQYVGGSLFFNGTWRNLHFFAEGGTSAQSWAASAGVLAALAPGLSLGIHARKFPESRFSPFGQPLAESSKAENERGTLLSLQLKPSKPWQIDLQWDQFRFPWLRYRVDAPSKGNEFLGAVTYAPNKQLRFQMRYKQSQNELNGSERPIANLEEVNKNSFRLELQYKASPSFTFRSRFERVQYNDEKGSLFYHDLIYKPLSSDLSGNMRMAFFDTDGYNSRVYAFENDVLYSYSIPAFQNRGMRYYLNLRYRLGRNLDFWTKISHTVYANLQEIGSGLDLIDGHRRSELKFQLRYQF